MRGNLGEGRAPEPSRPIHLRRPAERHADRGGAAIVALSLSLSFFLVTLAVARDEPAHAPAKDATRAAEDTAAPAKDATQGAEEAAPPQPERPKRVFGVRPAASTIRIDGALDEDAWSSATVIPIENEWFPGDNTPTVVRADCLVTYDHRNLYVAFRAEDADPAAIRAHLADRDTSFLDDTVGFLIDTFNDRRRAFQFRVNPLGVQMDATLSDVEGQEDWSWDAIWESAGRITDRGYTVEARVPFSSLRFPRTSGPQTWGFLAMRDYPRSTRRRMRSMVTDRNTDCIVCQFDRIEGLEGITPGANVELDPTLSGIQTDERDYPDDRIRETHRDTNAGITARWGITPNLVLGGALNPDFNGVEADAAQLSENARFALFFPEKRPLFLEGADFFSTPLPAVFTRTVADPKGALKITGKEGASAFGVFVAEDRENDLIFPANQFSFFARFEDVEVRSGVLRYRRDLAQTSNLGVLFTERRATGYGNRVYGVDGNLRFTDADKLGFQYLHSATEYPADVARAVGQPEGPFHGDGYQIRYVHHDRNWTVFADYVDLEPGFRADSGFIDRVDIKAASTALTRTLRGQEGSWFNQIELSLSADRTDDHGDLPVDHGEDVVVSYQGPLQSSVEVDLAWNRENFDGVAYDNFRRNLFFQIRPSGDFAVSTSATLGKTIDFANSRQADILTLRPGIEFSFGRHVGGTLEHVTERLDVTGGRLFTARLTQGRILYHVNRRMFVRAILQYLDVARNRDLYTFPVDSKTEVVFTQFLFSYKLNPQTVCLIGYSDNYLGLQSVDLSQTDRTFFVKLGYAWVL